MHRACCWLLLITMTAGCATYGPGFDINDTEAMNAELGKMDGESAVEQLQKMPRRAGVLPTAEQRGEFEGVLDSLQWANSSRPESTRRLVGKTPRGSYVRFNGPLFSSYQGTLLETRGDQVALANCVCRKAVLGSDGQVFARTTYAPFIEVDIAALSHMTVVAVPHRSDPVTLREETVQEIVFVSGRRRKVDVPPFPKWLTGDTSEAAMEEQRKHGPHLLLTIAAGSLITVRDEAGRWYEGLFLSADEATVTLQDCILVDSCNNPSGLAMSRVSYLYAQTVPTASVMEVVDLGPPPADFNKSDEECENCNFCVESFEFRSGSRRPLKMELVEHDPEEFNAEDEAFQPVRGPRTNLPNILEALSNRR